MSIRSRAAWLARSLAAPMLLLATLLPLGACGSSPKSNLRITSDPPGARVFLSRRGQQKVQAKVILIKGNVKAKSFEEEPFLLGTTPLDYSTPLEETSNDATVLGIGGKTIVFYEDGILTFERAGYEKAEKYVRFEKGRSKVHAEMIPAADED